MSFNTVLQTRSGIFILGICILLFCLSCIVLKMICVFCVNDIRQISKIKPVKLDEENEDIDNVKLVINPYDFVKIVDYKIVTNSNKKEEVEIILVEI